MGVQNYWIKSFNQNQINFDPPLVQTYSTQRPVESGCGSMSEMNFFYCFPDNNIYLSEDLFTLMSKQFDLPSIEFAIAHEYGHAVQKQLSKIQTTSMMREYQADCLSGVYMSRYSNIDDINRSVYNCLNTYTDKTSNFSSLFDPQSHGNSAARFEAFKKGFKLKEAKSCLDEYDLDNKVKELINGVVGQFSKDKRQRLTELDFVGRWQAGSKTFFTFQDNGINQGNVIIELYNGTIKQASFKVVAGDFVMKFNMGNQILETHYEINEYSTNTFKITPIRTDYRNSLGTIIKTESPTQNVQTFVRQ